MRYKGKVAVVTGGTSGIGLAVVRALLSEGADVVMSASGRNRGLEAEASLKQEFGDVVSFFCCDVENEKSVAELFGYIAKRYGRLDLLHNNAGVSVGGGLENTTAEEWNKTMNVNLRGAFFCARYALDLLKESKGAIVNTVSELGFVATQGCLAYLCSKGALLQLTRGLALELAPYGIRVNAVCPAGTDTPMLRADLGRDGCFEENARRLAGSYPLGRLGKPEDIAPAVLFLGGPEASFITGQCLLLDGGFTIQ